MKPRILVLALAAALGFGCSSPDQPRTSLQIQPVLSIRHGAPDAQAYYQLGRYFQGQYRFEQAETAYLKAIEADDRNIEAMNALASLYAERGELDRSAQLFQRVTELSPDVAYLYNNLGYAHLLQGRLDDAYTEVRKALSLDATLERGWANIERIAELRSDVALAEAAKSRRLDALPMEFATNAMPVQLAGELPPERTLALVMERSINAPAPLVAVADTPIAKPVGPRTVAPRQESDKRIAGGKFVLVSASREVVSNGKPIDIGQTRPAEPGDRAERSASVPAARIEVSNGNGVARFATRFSSRLKAERIPVTRITNNESFSLKNTIIEYQPGYELAARALMFRTHLAAHLVPAAKPRSGSDVRIVLGRDALQVS
jgi:Tfp pilus assembly protein PilF